jgi:MoxR-like ATPase
MSNLQQINRLAKYLRQQIIGQEMLVQRLLVGLLSGGHLLVEGAPGLAKTRAVKALADGIDADFHRVQFTPDLLPSDLTGSDVYQPEDGSFHFNKGPIFHNLLLADEINRAPAKVQSALLEAMAEHQVTVGAMSYPLPRLFLVMATQNPIEQEGTYPLPEAQLDRFLLHVEVGYPEREASRGVLRLARREMLEEVDEKTPKTMDPISQATIFAARKEAFELHLDDAVEEYILQIVEATRHPEHYGDDLAGWVRWGASPRGAISIERGARVIAWLDGRDFVTPDDVQLIAPDALRHRVLLDYAAEAEGITPQRCIDELLQRVPAP